MAGYYALKRSGTQFMFNLKAGNHESILTSERYATKQAAETGIASVKSNSASDARYTRKTSTSQQPYFVLTASNGQTIGASEMYSSAAAMEGGIASCKANGPTAPTKDET
ncbi:MAG: YegP family protein [Methylophilaceae bacterium]|jgi:uncharacterized protein YegP (UPF0339 family)|uniref:YegP family protein n=1 Tax=Methylibium sp. Root1272 TaxID=1736441 RepID=UPI0006FBBB95|nr:YegP family protein [Methylibium sp. Root1272]KQW70066.1 hypothetical protein ASC67_06200 [Methylibium sp. Root1272]